MSDHVKESIQSKISMYDSDDVANMMEINFLNEYNTFAEKISYKLKISSRGLFKLLSQKVGPDPRFTFTGSGFLIQEPGLMFRVVFDHFTHLTTPTKSALDDEVYGNYHIWLNCVDADKMDRIIAELKEALEPLRTNSVVWSFATNDGDINKKEIYLEPQEPLVKSFYPWLPTDTVQDYFRSYLDSNDSILLLTGIPGTGKTTFIRSLISENMLNADITYDERLIKSDSFFLRFLEDRDKDILVIEDADDMLYDREEDDNFLLRKILNISDGLVKNVSKKIVFSTNITDMERIDPALIRPGRCFDVLDFKKLTFEQACAVVDEKGLDRELTEERGYTLAEIFSSNHRAQKVKNRRVGF